MRKLALLFAVALSLLASPETALAGSGPRLVTAFAPGTFPESLAVDSHGDLFTSLGFAGRVVEVTPDGRHVTVATFDIGAGLIAGLAFDEHGSLYVADATFSTSPLPTIFRIGPDGKTTPVAMFGPNSFPNGLAFHEDYLYVSDAAHDVIWRVDPGKGWTVWLRNRLFAPGTTIGPNGLAFWGDSLYATSYDAGSIVRIPVRPDGSAGTPEVVIQDPRIRTADGTAFDVKGDLYIAVNDGRLMELTPCGRLIQLLGKRDGLNYPTMTAFGTTPGSRTTLYLTNGAFYQGTPDIVALDVGVRGLPLP